MVMTAESIFHEIRQALGGRPGQAIVLGVCQALAVRFRQEPWHVRLATLVLGLVWTWPVLAAYIILGFVLPETERRSRDFFTGAGIMAREFAQRFFAALGGLFGGRIRSPDQ
jgi:phage shock protein PspC (stress-responsive transcriptional regulator)